MKKKILTAALLGGIAIIQVASAQEFDDRWYLAGSTGFNFKISVVLPTMHLFSLLELVSSSIQFGRSTAH